MIELMLPLDALGRGIPAWLGIITLWTAALWLVARALDHGLRHRVPAAWRLPLYGIVLVRLVLPLDWVSPFSLLDGPTAASPAALASASVTNADAPALIELEAPALLGTSRSTPASAAATPAPAPELGWGVLVLLGWTLGTAVLLTRVRVGRRRLRTLATQSVTAPAALATGGFDVRVHDWAGPLAFGLRRPTIIIPRALLSADARALDCVLAHERAHLRRHDPLLANALAIIVAFAWPVLPIWLAARRARTLLELAADERAVRELDGHWRDYGRTMVELASRAPQGPLTALGLFGHVRERVEALRHRRRLGRGGSILVGLGAPVALLACAGVPAGDDMDEPDVTARCEAQAATLAAIPLTEPQRHAAELTVLADRYEEARNTTESSPACQHATRDALVSAATTWHDAAERSGDDELRALAADAYGRFVALFPDDDDAHAMRYYLGELLWARAVHAHGRSPDEAAAMFTRSRRQFVDLLERDPDGQYTADAAYAQVLAARNVHGEPAAPQAPRDADEPFPRLAYGPDAQVLVDSYRRYFAHAPEPNAQLGEVAMAWATLAMRHNHFDEARNPLDVALATLGDQPEVPEDAVRAAEMKLDLLTIAWTRDHRSTERAAEASRQLSDYLTELPTLALWSHPEATRLHEAVPPLEVGLAWKAAAALSAAGDHAGCGQAYDRIAAEHPDHPRVEDARSNAAACWQRAGER